MAVVSSGPRSGSMTARATASTEEFARGKLDDERLLLRAARKSRRFGVAPSRTDSGNDGRGGRRLASVQESRDGREAYGSDSLDTLQLVLDGLNIVRDIGRQRRGLTPEQRANQTDGAQRDKHTQRDGGSPPQSDPPKEIDQRREDEGQQDGQRHRDEDVLSDVERRNDDRPHDDRDQSPELRRRRGGNTGRRLERPQLRNPVVPMIVVARQLLLIRHSMNVLQRLRPPTAH